MMKQIGSLPYAITDDGKVINTNRNTVKKITFDKSGYGKVLLYDKTTDENLQFYVHQLIAENFLTKPEGLADPVVSFIDHDKTNLSAENLRWIDRADLNYENHAEGMYDMNKVKTMVIAEGFEKEFSSLVEACRFIAEKECRSFSSVWSVVARAGSNVVYNKYHVKKLM